MTRLADRILATDDSAHGPALADCAPRTLPVVENLLASQRVLARSFADTYALAESLAAAARRETEAQYRRALAVAAARSQEAAQRRAALTRRAARASGPRLTYLLALSGDANALDALRDRADSDEFAAEILAALDAEAAAQRVLSWTVLAVRLALSVVVASALYASRWTTPRPVSQVLRYSLDPSAPPVAFTRPADRPTVGPALAEVHASISTPIQEHTRIET